MLVCYFGSPVIHPVFQAFSSVIGEYFFFGHYCSGAVSFFGFCDGEVSGVVIIKDDVCGFEYAWFAWCSPSYEEPVIVEVLVEFVFVGVVAVVVGEVFVDGIG